MKATSHLLTVSGIVVLTLILMSMAANLIIDLVMGSPRGSLTTYIFGISAVGSVVAGLWRQLNK